jgi:hypothetical protein
MIEERIGSPPYELNWIACIPLLLLLAAASRLRIVFGLALRSRAQEDDGTAQRSGIGMNRSILASIHRPPSVTVCNATHGQQAAKPDPAFQGFGLSDANTFRTFEWEIHPNYRALGGQGQYHG